MATSPLNFLSLDNFSLPMLRLPMCLVNVLPIASLCPLPTNTQRCKGVPPCCNCCHDHDHRFVARSRFSWSCPQGIGQGIQGLATAEPVLSSCSPIFPLCDASFLFVLINMNISESVTVRATWVFSPPPFSYQGLHAATQASCG